MAHGLDSNVLVPVDENITLDEEYYLHGKTVICEFMKAGRVVFFNMSLKIRGKKPFTSLGTLQIRCPVPFELKRESWDKIRLRLSPNRDVHISKIYTNVTSSVSVCNLPHFDEVRERHGMSICTATDRGSREHFVEWIEYHKLVGIDHFFIYDTAIRGGDITSLLRDYIDEGVVTVIPWKFMNCVRYMANGR